MSLTLQRFLTNLDASFSHYLHTTQAPIYLGLSGGVDSVVLFHLLCKAGYGHRLKAIHIHHGISQHADAWLTFCQDLCRQYDVAFYAHKVDLSCYQGSVEEAARSARYEKFADHLQDKRAYLLLAHHAGDQAETLMFRLLRGTGGKGVAGMPAQRSIASGYLYRPLLAFDKSHLVEYAKQHELPWVEDESNQSEVYSRNYIRHRIMPSLRTFEAQADLKLAQTAKRLAFDYQMLANLSQEKLQHWQARDGSLILSDIQALPLEERLFWLRQYFASFALNLTQTQLQTIETSFFSQREKQPCFHHKEARFMRFQGRLYVLPHSSDSDVNDFALVDGHLERTFDDYRLQLNPQQGESYEDFRLSSKPEKAYLELANGHSRKLKKWLNDEQIPVWWREHLPYLYYQDELIAIADLWVKPSWSDKIQIQWRPKKTLPWP